MLLTVLAACGGDDSKTEVSDEAYLKVVCTGLTNFSNAIATKTKAEEIARVIKDFIVEMEKVEPPDDVQKFHGEFVKYLEDSVADPTSLLTRKPPLPPDDVRRRLDSKQASVAECKDPTFFTVQR